MARLPRLVVPHQPHHIVQQGNDRQPIFHAAEDYQRLLGWLRESARQYKVALHAYVLMPTQLQLLATPSDEEGLARTMQRVGRYYVPWYNAKYARSGSLFQGRFKTSVIDAAAYFLPCSLYIELAPVRAQLAAEALAYPWSSHARHAGASADAALTDHVLYWALGNTPFQREALYRQLTERSLTASQLALIDQAVLKGWPLGSDAFKAGLEKQAQRQVLPAKRGRPFKVKSPATEH